MEKWDDNTMELKESEWRVDDVVERVSKKRMSNSLARAMRVQMKTPQMKRAKMKRSSGSAMLLRKKKRRS